MVNKICQGIGVDIQLLLSTEVCAAIETLLAVPELPSLEHSCLHQVHPRFWPQFRHRPVSQVN